MPSGNNVQILKESKARFEGVIFNQTADLGTNKSTSCKVIDEATGEVIAQSGGGGDFEEFEITFDITPPAGVVVARYTIYEAKIAYPDENLETGQSFYYATGIGATSAKIKILAYKGTAYFGNFTVDDGNNTTYYPDTDTQVLSDTVTYDSENELYTVTGNATIKATVATE